MIWSDMKWRHGRDDDLKDEVLWRKSLDGVAYRWLPSKAWDRGVSRQHHALNTPNMIRIYSKILILKLYGLRSILVCVSSAWSTYIIQFSINWIEFRAALMPIRFIALDTIKNFAIFSRAERYGPSTHSNWSQTSTHCWHKTHTFKKRNENCKHDAGRSAKVIYLSARSPHWHEIAKMRFISSSATCSSFFHV